MEPLRQDSTSESQPIQKLSVRELAKLHEQKAADTVTARTTKTQQSIPKFRKDDKLPMGNQTFTKDSPVTTPVPLPRKPAPPKVEPEPIPHDLLQSSPRPTPAPRKRQPLPVSPPSEAVATPSEPLAANRKRPVPHPPEKKILVTATSVPPGTASVDSLPVQKPTAQASYEGAVAKTRVQQMSREKLKAASAKVNSPSFKHRILDQIRAGSVILSKIKRAFWRQTQDIPRSPDLSESLAESVKPEVQPPSKVLPRGQSTIYDASARERLLADPSSPPIARLLALAADEQALKQISPNQRKQLVAAILAVLKEPANPTQERAYNQGLEDLPKVIGDVFAKLDGSKPAKTGTLRHALSSSLTHMMRQADTKPLQSALKMLQDLIDSDRREMQELVEKLQGLKSTKEHLKGQIDQWDNVIAYAKERSVNGVLTEYDKAELKKEEDGIIKQLRQLNTAIKSLSNRKAVVGRRLIGFGYFR